MRRLVALLAVAAGLAATASPTAAAGDELAIASFAPSPHDDRAEGGPALDLAGARFGQIADGDLQLAIRTYAPWQPVDVDSTQPRMLCVWLRADGQPAPSGRVCVVAIARAKSGVGLRYTALGPAGNSLGIRELGVEVRRPAPTMARATFSPALLRLLPGLYHWQVRSLAGGVQDFLPNSGEVPLRIEPAGTRSMQQRCFGAASRDILHRCVNPILRRVVLPAPDDAVLAPNSPCLPIEIAGMLRPCEFGLPAAQARKTIALLGDSHAAHWRAALEFVAQRQHSRGISITRSGCPLSQAPARLAPVSRQTSCLQWNAQVAPWFAQHPEIHTVIVVAHVAAQVIAAPGMSAFETKVAGFQAAWNALPKSVSRIVVIHDTPLVGYEALSCIRAAHARHQDAGRVCAVTRAAALRRPDPEVAAARRLGSRRVRVIDLTRFLCDRRLCFPVIGGALVYKDDQHLTDVFAKTLGPYLERALENAAGWPSRPRAATQRRPKLIASVTPSPRPSNGAPSAMPTPASR